MKVLVDADILLDVALNRQPFVNHSGAVIEWCQAFPQSALVAWHTVSNLYYLLRAAHSDEKARGFISDALRFAEVGSGGTDAVRHALTLRIKDFEDALQVAVAVASNAQFIMTRNIADYRGSPIPVISPRDFLGRFVK